MAQQTDSVAHALAGAGGGLLSMTLTYPLINLSTRAQVESRRISQSQTLSRTEKQKRIRSTTLAAARHIIRREGLSGLYSGLESALFGISVTNFVYYYWYEWTRAFFLRAAAQSDGAAGKRGRLTALQSVMAGTVAGAATVLMTNPIWVVNTRMTASTTSTSASADEEKGGAGAERGKRKRPSTLTTLLSLLHDEGFRGLFKGVLPALVLVINPIMQYTIFEQLRNVLEKRRKVGPWDVFALGALGKLAATTITYPYITVKSRMHVAKKGGEEKGEGEGMVEGMRRCVREEGWGGLYKGIGPKVSQSVITAALLFAFKDVLYEASLKARRTIPKNLHVG